MQMSELFKNLIIEAGKLHEKKMLSERIGPEYFEPGRMEFLDQYEGIYNEDQKELLLRFESKGTRYSGRTEQIEKVKTGDPVRIIRDKENRYNSNNFLILTSKGKDIGNMPAELCDAIAPLYDRGELFFTSSKASFVEPISKRSRYAKQAILFIELLCQIDAEKGFIES